MLDDQSTGMERLKMSLDYGPSNVNKWVKLVYDFTGQPTETYDQLRLTYNHGSTTTEFWYFNDVIAQVASNLSSSQTKEITKLITVYPNPSTGVFYIDTKDIFPTGSSFEIEVMDMQGRSLFSRDVIAQGMPVTFDLNNYPTGSYFLRLSGEALHYVKAIQKKE